MRATGLRLLALAVMVSSFVSGSRVPTADASAGMGESRTGASAVPYAHASRPLPVEFEANRGQADPALRYLYRSPGLELGILSDGAVFLLPGGGPGAEAVAAIRMRFAGEAKSVDGVRPLPGRSNYFLGRDSSRWIRGIPRFGAVEQREVVPGVTVRWHGDGGRLEYDLLVAPGADPTALVEEFEGQGVSRVDADGSLVLEVPGGALRQGRPVAWQVDGDGVRAAVSAGFEAAGPGRFRLRVGAHDASRPLVVDPTIESSRYVGSPSVARSRNRMAMGVDRSIYVTGRTLVGDSLLTNPPVRFDLHVGCPSLPHNLRPADPDGFILRLTPDQSAYVYADYFGGKADDVPTALAVDGEGEAVVAGRTASTDFPSYIPLFTHMNAEMNPFVMRFGQDGKELCFATYVPGTASTVPTDVALDSTDAIVVSFSGVGNGFPLVKALQGIPAGPVTGGLLKMEGMASKILFSTTVGGSGGDTVNRVAVDAADRIWVAGTTGSADLPVKNPLQAHHAGGPQDAFVARFTSDGSACDSMTYLGGSGYDEATALRVSANGTVLVAGSTGSADFPAVDGHPLAYGGGEADAFVSRITASGSTLVSSTLLGGSGWDAVSELSVDEDGNVWVAGTTGSADLPVSPAFQKGYGGGSTDGFLAELPPSLGSLLFASFMGGSGEDSINSIVASGQALVSCGDTTSGDVPTMPAFQAGNYAGNPTLFIDGIGRDPGARADFNARLTALSAVTLSWRGSADRESSIEVERAVDGGAFTLFATIPPETTSVIDDTLVRGSFYAYRIRAVNASGKTAYSAVLKVLSPVDAKTAPVPPEDLQGDLDPTGHPILSWQDQSTDEDLFEVYRADPENAWAIVGNLRSGTTGFSDPGVLPDREYSYAVRAVNQAGASGFTPALVLTTPGTVQAALRKGRIVDSPKPGRDALKFDALPTLLGGALDAGFDPVGRGLVVRIGDSTRPPVLAIPAGDPGWKSVHGRCIWKPPQGSHGRGRVDFDPKTATLKVDLQGFEFTAPVENPVTLWIGSGGDAGHSTLMWVGSGHGILRLPGR